MDTKKILIGLGVAVLLVIAYKKFVVKKDEPFAVAEAGTKEIEPQIQTRPAKA